MELLCYIRYHQITNSAEWEDVALYHKVHLTTAFNYAI